MNEEYLETCLSEVTLACVSGLALFAGWTCLNSQRRHSVMPVIIVNYMFTGVPLFLDLAFGKPAYHLFKGNYAPSRDLLTSIWYCAYITLCSLIWVRWGRGHLGISVLKNSEEQGSVADCTFVRISAYIIAYAPMFLVLMSPDPTLYLHYADVLRYRPQLSDEFGYHHMLVENSCQLALVALMILLIAQRKASRLKWLNLLPPAVLSMWLIGKRYAIAETLLFCLIAFWLVHRQIGFKLLATFFFALVIVGAVSVVYQKTVRSIDIVGTTQESGYDLYRLDYTRDAGIKMALYAEMHSEEEPILPFRGHSLYYYATMAIPSTVWPEKPWSYANYSACRQLLINPRYLKWGITTSLLEEMVANIGWAGIILAPLVVLIICRIGDRTNDPVVQLLTIMVCSLLLSVQMSSFISVVALWVAFTLWSFFKKKRQQIPSGLAMHHSALIRGMLGHSNSFGAPPS